MNSENFSLDSFFPMKGVNLLDRVHPFASYLHQNIEQGRANYGRVLLSPPGARVQVRDPRTGEAKELLMLGSNDYLGLTTHPHVIAAVRAAVLEWGVGMGGPPLLNGMGEIHLRLEQALSSLKHQEASLLFASGFQANSSWISALLRSDDTIIYDQLNHASLIDGIKLARTAQRIHQMSFHHNDLDHLEACLVQSRAKRKGMLVVAVEGVYSMDGDLAPLPEIVKLCKQYEAALFVDDAHGTGVYGATGSGTAEHFGVEKDVDLSLGTFSKAFGVTGGFISAKRSVVDCMRFFSRTYMFSAHLPQALAAAVLAGIEVLKAEPELRTRLHQNSRKLRQGLQALGLSVGGEAPILPVLIPEHVDIRDLSRRLHEEGIFANVVEYPAVPRNAQRVRLSVMATHTDADIQQAIHVFQKLTREFSLA